MKVSLNWLTDFVDVSAVPVRRLADMLTHIGLCCDAVQETQTDVVLELDVTSNRPDCLCQIGVAREVAAMLKLPLKLPDLTNIPAGPAKAVELTGVQVLDPDLCPRYTARVIRNVKIGPSPAWMVERLSAVGIRSINNVVDVTNYVMLEYSQPLHSFDYDRLEERRIIVRRGREGEVLVSIDGTHCRVKPDMLVIADGRQPVALAGIMGGLASEISAATVNVLLESAQFDPLTTRKTARALAISTESSYRFERGIDPVGVDAASLRACQLMLQTAGGELASGLVDVWAAPYKPPVVSMRTARCRTLLGADVPDADQVEILSRLNLSPKVDEGSVVCTIPGYRSDLTREADLIEEVARLYGLDKIPWQSTLTHAVVGIGLPEQTRRALRDVLSAAGVDEVVTFGFVDDAEAALLGFSGGVRVDPTVRKSNNLLRPTLLPSLLRVCRTNQDAGNAETSVYELASVFPAAKPASLLPDEHVSLGLATQRDARFLRGVLEALVERIARGTPLEAAPARIAGLADGASAQVRLDGKVVGILGPADQAVLDYYGLDRPYALASIRFDALLEHAGREVRYQPLGRFPPVRRDLSIVVDESVAWRQVEQVIRDADEPALENLEYVGAFRGPQLEPGKKSVTVSLTYRLAGQTLRHEQVDQMVSRIEESLALRLKATLRK